METGEVLDDNDRMSDQMIEELAEIGRRLVGQELIDEFQKVLSDAHRLYAKSEKLSAEHMIDPRTRGSIPINTETTLNNNLKEVPGS